MANNFIGGFVATGSSQNTATLLTAGNGTYLIGATGTGNNGTPLGVRLPTPAAGTDNITIIPIQGSDILVYVNGSNGFYNYASGIKEIPVQAGATLTFLANGYPGVGDPDNWYTYPNPLGAYAVVTGAGSGGSIPSNLQAINAIFPGTGELIIGNGATWIGQSGTAAQAAIGLSIGTTVQAHSPILDSVSSLVSSGFLAISGTTVTATGITASGDATGTSFGTNLPLTLGTTGVVAGTYGDANNVPEIVVDDKGRVTFGTQFPINPGGTGSVTEVIAEAPLFVSVLDGTITSTGTVGILFSSNLQNNAGSLDLNTNIIIAGTATAGAGSFSGTVSAGTIFTNGTEVISAAGTGLTISTPGTVQMGTSGVVAGTYNLSTITVDALGRITSASTGSAGTGSVTNVATDATLTGGPITSVGTLGINLSNSNNWLALQTFGSGLSINTLANNQLLEIQSGGERFDYVSPPGPIGTLTPVAGSGLPFAAQYEYVVTFVNKVGETNAGSSASVTTTSGSLQVQLSGIPTSTDNTVTARKIYRTKFSLSSQPLLITTLNDNTTTTYLDNNPDGTVGVTAPVPLDNTTAGRIFAGTDVVVTLGNMGNTLTFGIGASAPGLGCIAIGSATAGSNSGINGEFNSNNIAIGNKAWAGDNSLNLGSAIAIGYNGSATGYLSIALGANGTASGQQSVAIGYSSIATGANGLAMAGGIASGSSSIAIGNAAQTNSSALAGIAIGVDAFAFAPNAIAIGGNSVSSTLASGTNAIAIGLHGTASGSNSIVIGNGTASAAGQTIIGYGSGTLNLTSAGVLTAANLSGTNTGDQLAGTGLTLSSGTFSITPTGVTAGSYNVLTVNTLGQVTAGTNLTVATWNGSAPAHPTDTGTIGDYYADGSFAYFFSSAGTWIRVAADLSWT